MTKGMQVKVILLSSILILNHGLALAEYPSVSAPLASPQVESTPVTSYTDSKYSSRVYSEKSPQASNGILRNYIFEKQLLSTASPGKTTQAAEADIWYQGWETEDVDGDSYGTHLTYTRGEKHNFTATVPIYAINPDVGEDMTAIGLDGAYRFQLNEVIGFGAHANYIYETWSGDLDSSDSMSIGTFVTAGTNIGEKWTIAGVLIYDYTTMTEDDDYIHYLNQFMPGATIGFQVMDSLSLNLFGFYHALLGLDSEFDDAYYDGGIQMAWQQGSWGVSLTAKQTFDLDNFEMYEIHLGTAFRW